jgi:TonB family protein
MSARGLCGIWLVGCVAACASAPVGPDAEVVVAYQLFATDRCDEIYARRDQIEEAQEDRVRVASLYLIAGYCRELSREFDQAKQRYFDAIGISRHSRAADEAALRLSELKRVERGGPDRDALLAERTRRPEYDHGARPIQRATPQYPNPLRAARIEGWVAIDFGITSGGGVTDALVVASEPPFIFEAAALAAMRHWVYEPSVAAEPRRVRVRVDFELND